ncbi:MAG: hypothetical protein IT270_06130 [Saprospiraceae bacterium]|nr:hypothetical protein [Saprospiraceae bacterium]
MGLFDFLKKKEQPTEFSKTEKTIEKETEPYLGVLTKTDILYKLVQTPQNERDEKWQHRQDGNGVSQDIVFNLTPKNFKDENTYRAVMQTISWYLPRHYSFVGMDEQSLGNGFMPM